MMYQHSCLFKLEVLDDRLHQVSVSATSYCLLEIVAVANDYRTRHTHTPPGQHAASSSLHMLLNATLHRASRSACVSHACKPTHYAWPDMVFGASKLLQQLQIAP